MPQRRRDFLTAAALGAATLALPPAANAEPLDDLLRDATPLLPPDAAIASTKGLGVSHETFAVTGQPFAQAARVTIPGATPDTNTVQMIVPIVAPVTAGDVLLAVAYLRGKAASGGPASVILTFEKNGQPYTKSLFERVSGPAPTSPDWQRVLVPFTASETYAAGGAFCAVRLALGAQTVDIGGLQVYRLAPGRKLADVKTQVIALTPLGAATVTVRGEEKRQVMAGFGGNYAKSGIAGGVYQREALDAVGKATLELLAPAHARVGLPFKVWAAAPGKYAEDAPIVRSTWEMMGEMARRKIPLAVAVWDAPDYMIEDPKKLSQRRIRPERYDPAIDALVRFLVIARDRYKAPVENLSFNEADGGYQIKFTSAEIAAFILQAAPRFAAEKLTTKWLIGDTSNGGNCVRYARPLLENKELAPHLGPLSFHSWDALGAPDATYAGIAALGREFNKPVWCLEVGHDAQLWQAKPSVWDTWDNALRLAQVFVKSIAVAGASLLDYWEYVSDYPLTAIGPDGKPAPYPALRVIQQLQAALPAGAQVIGAASDNAQVQVVATTQKQGGKTRTSVVLVNRGGAGPIILSGLPPRANFTLTQSTSNAQLISPRRFYPSDTKGSLSLPLPAQAVVTLMG